MGSAFSRSTDAGWAGAGGDLDRSKYENLKKTQVHENVRGKLGEKMVGKIISLDEQTSHEHWMIHQVSIS